MARVDKKVMRPEDCILKDELLVWTYIKKVINNTHIKVAGFIMFVVNRKGIPLRKRLVLNNNFIAMSCKIAADIERIMYPEYVHGYSIGVNNISTRKVDTAYIV